MKKIQIICVNDFHAEICQSEATPGCAGLAAEIRQYLRTHKDTIILFGGDNYKGDPVSEYTGGYPVTALMKSLHTTASVIGNHEFDYSLTQLEQWQRDGGYQFLAANLTDQRTGARPAFIKPYVMVECGGLKVAILGLVTPEALDTKAHPPDIRTLRITDGTKAALAYTEYLLAGKAPEGIPDVVIALTHFGFMYDEKGQAVGQEIHSLCDSGARIDGVFAAHWHQFMALTVNGIPVAQGGSRGQGFAVLTIEQDEQCKSVFVRPSYVKLGKTPAPLPDQRLQAVVLGCYQEAMKELGTVLGRLTKPLRHRDLLTNEVPYEGTAFSQLALQAMMNKTGCRIGLLYAGWLGSGLEKGPVTKYDLWQNVRFNGSIVAMKVSGAVLLENLSIGMRNLRTERLSPLAVLGLRLEILPAKPYRERLSRAVLSSGEPIREDEFYQIVTDSGIAESTMGFDFSKGVERIYYEESLRDCIAEELKKLCSR